VQKCRIYAVLLCTVLVTLLSPASLYSQQEEEPKTRRVLSRVTPQYPELARSMRIEGTVKVLVTVGVNGRSTSIKLVGGHPLLAKAATAAIEKWRWTAASEETTELVELHFHPE
jgi:TonB family protein